MVELCLENLEDIYIAEKNKDIVKRIELNSALSIGGLTPNIELLKKAKRITNIPIICMLRLRAGNFIYSNEEMDIMIKDAKKLIKYCDGLAFGALNENLEIDEEKTKKILDICLENRKEFVFHRAVDLTKNYFNSIKQLDCLGVTRILTSGGKKNCDDGYESLIKLKTKCSILVGGGINNNNISNFLNFEIHGSFSEKNEDMLGSHLNLSEEKLNKIRDEFRKK